MNQQTLDLIVRPYGEIVDDLLTAVVGGVVNEPILYDDRATRYALAEPARAIRAITGTANSEHFQFRNEVDFLYDQASNSVVWLDDADQKPDDDTTIYVDYYRRFSESPVSDINVGSVTRTVLESIARETAFVYRTINQAYLMGFIDTAIGKSLDQVVAILDVKRKDKDYAVGQVTFFRDPASPDGNITIPEGVWMRTDKGNINFVTVQMRTLQRGQARIDVPIRATDGNKGPDGVVNAGLINTLAIPIAGIARISNFDATSLGEAAETDDELRARTKAVIRGAGKGTLEAIRRAIAEERTKLVEHWDPNNDPDTDPGTVKFLVDVKPGRYDSVLNAVNETRAAGIRVQLLAKYVYIRPRIEVVYKPGLNAAAKLKATRQIIDELRRYTDQLEAGVEATGKGLRAAIENVKEVTGTIKHVIVQHTDLNPDLKQTPAGGLKTQSSLLVITKGDLETGDFVVSTKVDSTDGWTITLDMSESDIAEKTS